MKLDHYDTMGITHTPMHMQTHTHINTHTHTHSPVLGTWGDISTITEILELPKYVDTLMSQNHNPT
jgi:hypothetical protein